MTHFMRFHPGGKAQLMRGAGNDCTELFDKVPLLHVHNYQTCVVQSFFNGYLWGTCLTKMAFVKVSKCLLGSDLVNNVFLFIRNAC